MKKSITDRINREGPKNYKNYLGIASELFYVMVEKLTPHLKKKTTCMRLPLEVDLKLAVTLRFLATGYSYKSLQYNFKHNFKFYTSGL